MMSRHAISEILSHQQDHIRFKFQNKYYVVLTGTLMFKKNHHKNIPSNKLSHRAKVFKMLRTNKIRMLPCPITKNRFQKLII